MEIDSNLHLRVIVQESNHPVMEERPEILHFVFRDLMIASRFRDTTFSEGCLAREEVLPDTIRCYGLFSLHHNILIAIVA